MERIDEMKEGIVELLRERGKMWFGDIVDNIKTSVPPIGDEDKVRESNGDRKKEQTPYEKMISKALRTLVADGTLEETTENGLRYWHLRTNET